MMQVRCQSCGWMFTLGREAIGLALAEAKAHNEQYHSLPCPQCRHVIKLQISELQHRLPPDYVLPEWTPGPEPQSPPPATETVAPPVPPAPTASRSTARKPAKSQAKSKAKAKTPARSTGRKKKTKKR